MAGDESIFFTVACFSQPIFKYPIDIGISKLCENINKGVAEFFDGGFALCKTGISKVFCFSCTAAKHPHAAL